MKHRLSTLHRFTLGLLGLIAGALAIPAVVSAAPSTPAATPDPNWLRPDTAAVITYPDADITSRPAAAAGRVDRNAALHQVDAASFATELRPGTPETALRSMTRQPKGQAKAEYTDRLSWVITYRNSAPQVSGSATMKAADREKIAANLHCVMVFLVDASTGEVYDAQQYCKS